MVAKFKIFVTISKHCMNIKIVYRYKHIQFQKVTCINKKVKQIKTNIYCKERILSDHRCEIINVAVKCKIFVTVTYHFIGTCRINMTVKQDLSPKLKYL